METNQSDSNQPIAGEVKENKFRNFIFKHKVAVIFILIAIAVFIWAQVKICNMEKNFSKQKSEIINNYEIKIDSLNLATWQLTSKVFSWAIRSELIRENIEQVNQFFLSFIKEPNITKIQLINPEDSFILISSDKKDEGQLASEPIMLLTDKMATYKDSLLIKTITPIMGLNSKIGILVIEVKNRN
ncbi:MAG: hypothetical protein U1C46_05570 [Bacteroidales bacterium]|nr:hypothetical protein [Bacteroidales bacterium]